MNEDGDIVDEDGAGVRVPRRRVCFRARSLLVSASVVARYTSMRRVKASAAHLPRQGISDCSIPDMHACAVANVQLGDGPRADFLTVEEADGGGNSDRITTKYMTKYERARILGTRALQLRCVTSVVRVRVAYTCVLVGLGCPWGQRRVLGLGPLPASQPGSHAFAVRLCCFGCCVCPDCLSSMNAPPMVDVAGLTDPLQIAMKELRAGKVPLIVRRYLPDGSYEDWPLKDLIIDFAKH